MPRLRAPRCTSSQYAGGNPQIGLHRTLTRDTVGGREMKPAPTGLTASAMTIGIVFVARMAAAVDSLAPVTMTSGLSRTTWSARGDNRSL
jgi:hypothetical protein